MRRIASLALITVAAVATTASTAGAWTGPVTLTGVVRAATPVTDPSGGMHLISATSTEMQWQTFSATGELAAPVLFPGHHGNLPLASVSWMPDGRALVGWGTGGLTYFAIRMAGGSWGPNAVFLNDDDSAGAAIREGEALVSEPGDNVVQQLLIAPDGTLTKGTKTSLLQSGDSGYATGGAIALDPDGTAVLVYRFGLAVRLATRDPQGAWTVTTLDQVTAPAGGGAALTPVWGSAQRGRLVVTYGKTTTTTPSSWFGADVTSTVRAAVRLPGQAPQIVDIATGTTGAGESLLSETHNAAAGADGSLVAWGGTYKCLPDHTQTGSLSMLAAGPTLTALGGAGAGQSVSPTNSLRPRFAYAGPTGTNEAISAFAGGGLIASYHTTPTSSANTDCDQGGQSYDLFGDAIGSGVGSGSLWQWSNAGGLKFTSYATAMDGHQNGVITGTKHTASPSTDTFLMWTQGTPGSGVADTTGGDPPGDGTTTGGGTPSGGGTPPGTGTTPGGGSPSGGGGTVPHPAPGIQPVKFVGVSATNGSLNAKLTIPPFSGNLVLRATFIIGGATSRGVGAARKPLVVATFTKTFKKAGNVTLRIPFTKAGKKRLKGKSKVSGTLRITMSQTGKKSVTVQRRLTVKLKTRKPR